MTTEIVANSMNKDYSCFAQDTLYPSLSLVDSWEKKNADPVSIKPYREKGVNKNKYDLSPDLMNMMGDTICFPYPDLLPSFGINMDENSKPGGKRNKITNIDFLQM